MRPRPWEPAPRLRVRPLVHLSPRELWPAARARRTATLYGSHSVPVALLTWAMPRMTDPMRSAILASGSGTNRTSLVRCLSMDSPITDISGSITTSQPIVMIRCRVPLIVELIIIAHNTSYHGGPSRTMRPSAGPGTARWVAALDAPGSKTHEFKTRQSDQAAAVHAGPGVRPAAKARATSDDDRRCRHGGQDDRRNVNLLHAELLGRPPGLTLPVLGSHGFRATRCVSEGRRTGSSTDHWRPS
jgi:hypothetical protein